MKKYSLLYIVSFISYFLVLQARPYITAQTWADMCMFLFIGCCIYQFIYIIYLRKKDNISLGRSIANFFLYVFIVLIVCVVYFYSNAFFLGYTDCSFHIFYSECYGTYYGFEAWKYTDWENFVYGIISVICFTYFTLYYIISKRIKIKKSNR